MQNGQNIAGNVSIGAGGTLWVSEHHGVDTVFNATNITGSGIVQVQGSSPVAKFTNVNAAGNVLRVAAGGTVRILNGTSTFGSLDAASYGGNITLDNGTLAMASGNFVVPTNMNFTGTNALVAKGGNLVVNGTANAAGGSLTLDASGDLQVLGSVSGGTIKLKGANVLIGDSVASSAASVNASSLLDILTAGALKIKGGSGSGASALASSSGTLTVSASGDVLLSGGAGANAWAKLSGNPDAVLSKVGGVIRMDAGTGSGAYAAIESVSPNTINITFPNLASGGYFVNGVEGTVYSAGTGFIAGGSAAVLGSSLKITYGSGSTNAVEGPIQTLIAAIGESIEPPEAEKDKDVFQEEKDSKKKDLPVCK